MKIIETIPKEEILSELIKVNEELYQSLVAYQQFAKTGKRIVKEVKKEIKKEDKVVEKKEDFFEMFNKLSVEESNEKKPKLLNLDELLGGSGSNVDDEGSTTSSNKPKNVITQTNQFKSIDVKNEKKSYYRT